MQPDSFRRLDYYGFLDISIIFGDVMEGTHATLFTVAVRLFWFMEINSMNCHILQI